MMLKLMEQINNSPPIIKELISDEVEKELIKKNIRNNRIYSSMIVKDLTEIIIKSKITGKDYSRLDYTLFINDDLYYSYVEIAENFVNTYYNKLIGSKRFRDSSLSDYDDY